MKNSILFICVLLAFQSRQAFAVDTKDNGDFLHFINNTPYDIGELVFWTCDYLEIKNVTICVCPQLRYYKEEAFVIKEDNFYYIYLQKDIKNIPLILIHELIHVKQYETNDLTILGPFTVRFRGSKLDLQRTEYAKRPFEIEAHMMDSKILSEYYRYRKSVYAKAEKCM